MSVSLTAYAQSNPTELKELLDSETINNNLSNLEKLELLKKSQLVKETYKKIQRQDLDKIQSSQLEIICLKKNTTLLSIDISKTYKTKKAVYVQAYRLSDSFNYRYIVNKNKELKYIVPVKSVSSIKTVTSMREPPEYYTPAPTLKKRADKYDKFLNYKFGIEYGIGSTNPLFSKDLFELKSSGSFLTQSLRGSIISNWKASPIQIGLNLGYSTFSFIEDEKKGTSQKVLAGIRLESQNFPSLYNLFLFTNIDISLSSSIKINDGSQSIKLSDTKADLGFAFSRQQNNRTWDFGVYLSRTFSKPRELKNKISVTPKRSYDDGFSFFISHRWFQTW